MIPISENRAIRILCVDDEATILRLLSLLLTQRGYQVEVAADGATAWEMVAHDPTRFDVVVTDNQMPGMSGVELVQKLRANGFAGRVVFFCVRLSPQAMADLADVSYDAFVEKGRPVSELYQALHPSVIARRESFSLSPG
jgi:two-component system, OmpR family, alkaline phosphatase synthesis response regulator PhoP